MRSRIGNFGEGGLDHHPLRRRIACRAFSPGAGWVPTALFSVWALFLVSPALLTFVKVYEERELESRFGEPYLEYKHRTPMLFPRKPRKA